MTDQLLKLAEIFRTDHGPDMDMAAMYLKVSTNTLLNDLHLDEGMFGVEVWAAAEALKVRGEDTPFSRWLLSDRKQEMPIS